MARFNLNTKGKDKTENYEGAVAYKLSPELELYTAVVCASLQPKFYQPNTKKELKRIRNLIKKCEPKFVSNLAIYTREQMYLRSIPLVLAVELAKVHSGDTLVSETVEKVINRADELTELLSYYQQANERTGTKKLNKLSKQIQKGLANAFLKFDEYALQKYNRDSEVKLKDVLFLCHVKPTEDKIELFKKLINDTLETPYTWEVELSKVDDRTKTQKWEDLIDSNKVGYMALLRNLRNILEANVSLKHIQKVCTYLSSPAAVRTSKQLPFRFLSAYRKLQPISNPYTSIILNALEDAVLTSAENIKGYDYDTSVLIACDVSGSMHCPISKQSKIQNYDIGLILAMLLQNRCKASITGIFGNDWRVKNLPKKSILQNVIDLHAIHNEVGLSTNGWKVLTYLIDNKIKVDKIMMFTDNQMWDSSGGSNEIRKYWTEYKKFNPTCKLYLFDLKGYGNTPIKINENDVFLIAGWSDRRLSRQ